MRRQKELQLVIDKLAEATSKGQQPGIVKGQEDSCDSVLFTCVSSMTS